MVESGRQPPPARYAVVFQVGQAAPAAGALIIEGARLRLEGRGADGRVQLGLGLAELREVRIGRAPDERLNGRPSLLLLRRQGPAIRIEPLGAGLLHELTNLLASLSAEHAAGREQVVVVVPLKRGCLERARELVAEGPPFDPPALGLVRHEVFLTSERVVFLFVGPQVRERLERALQDPTLWRAGLAWRACIAGRPRFLDAPAGWPGGAERVYRWVANDG